jgi:regulator of protease activity HflC (stomatin/prohibitin superfamily)
MFIKTIIFLTLFITVNSIWVVVEEGHKGIWTYLGQIQDKSFTGLTFNYPFISSITEVKYIEDPDKTENVKCVSKEGVDITIKSIEIANKINPDTIIKTVKLYGFQYDRKIVLEPLEQKMREVCAEMTVDEIEITRFKELDDILKQDIQAQLDAKDLGITVTWVRITGIIVPAEIKVKRLALASEKAEKILVEEKNKRLTTEKIHEEAIAKKNAEIELTKAKSVNDIKIANAHSEKEIKTIEYESLVQEGNARATKIRAEASALQDMDKLINYYKLEEMKALAEGSKLIYWGNSLPKVAVGSDIFNHQ